MSHKVFVSYKYHDSYVRFLPTSKDLQTKVRDYVDILEEKLGKNNIFKGEQDGEDLSKLKDDTIWEKLKKRIYDSSVTIVCISPGMKETGKYDKSQWIPWEVRYSLCEYSKDQRTSHTNGLIGLVLPDMYGNYDYVMKRNSCCYYHCDTINLSNSFYIIEKNMFNRIENAASTCNAGTTLWAYDDSYMIMVRWDDFIKNIDVMNEYIEAAFQRAQHKNDYELRLEIDRSK